MSVPNLHSDNPTLSAIYKRQIAAEVPETVHQAGWLFKAKSILPASPFDDTERHIIDKTVEFCEKRGIKNIPDIYILDTPIPNAASVSGRHMIITTEIMKTLTDDQLDAIIGHELSHHRHHIRDLVAQAGLAYTGSEVATFAWQKGMKFPMKNLPRLIQYAVQESSALPIYFGAMLSVVPYRHFMELEADKEGAQLTSPLMMANALENLESKVKQIERGPQEPQGTLQKLVKVVFFPFSTHPSTEKRLARLSKMPSPQVNEPQNHEKMAEQAPSLSQS